MEFLHSIISAILRNWKLDPLYVPFFEGIELAFIFEGKLAFLVCHRFFNFQAGIDLFYGVDHARINLHKDEYMTLDMNLKVMV